MTAVSRAVVWVPSGPADLEVPEELERAARGVVVEAGEA